jgi:hypothetical protein
MPIRSHSKARGEYFRNGHEIFELLRTVPYDSDQMRSLKARELANALLRGSVVLLSSHLERYVESLVVEAVDALNLASLTADVIPEVLQLAVISEPVRQAHETKDSAKKASKLRALVDGYAWFWEATQACKLSSEVLIRSFDNPLPERIRVILRNFGISDAVGLAVAQYENPDRRLIEAKVQELVEKRNAVAHTGMTFDLTKADVVSYLVSTHRLVRGLDVVVGQAIQDVTGAWPWNP